MDVYHPYFVRQNTDDATKVHIFLHILSFSADFFLRICDFTPKCLTNQLPKLYKILDIQLHF